MQKNTKDSSSKKVVNKSKEMPEISTIKPAKKTSASTKKAVAKSSAKKATTTTAKTTTMKTAVKTADTKKATTKKPASKTSKKSTTKKTSVFKTKKVAKKVEVIEYYDLPYRYNQTVVRILAQTPNTLFVYWDISDEDRKKYINEFGKDFFNTTVPVLIVHNKTMNYSFEIEINDFANSWYFNVNDSKCDYEIELGRRSKPNTIDLPNNYMYVTSSNVIESPNNHILFEKNQKVLFFRNVKTNETIEKDFSKFEFMNYAGRIHNIDNMYKKIYRHEELYNLENLSSSKV